MTHRPFLGGGVLGVKFGARSIFGGLRRRPSFPPTLPDKRHTPIRARTSHWGGCSHKKSIRERGCSPKHTWKGVFAQEKHTSMEGVRTRKAYRPFGVGRKKTRQKCFYSTKMPVQTIKPMNIGFSGCQTANLYFSRPLYSNIFHFMKILCCCRHNGDNYAYNYTKKT